MIGTDFDIGAAIAISAISLSITDIALISAESRVIEEYNTDQDECNRMLPGMTGR